MSKEINEFMLKFDETKAQVSEEETLSELYVPVGLMASSFL